jgi:alpha-tubulin suppressor-like RCC1 family protein
LAVQILFLSACSERIAVLGPSSLEQSGKDGGPRDGSIEPTTPPPPDRDAGRPPQNSGGSGPPISTGSGTVDGGMPPQPTPSCDLECGPNELCTWRRCVPAQGVMSLASSFGHSCSVESGRLYCWGPNEKGQLGLGDREPRDRRTRVGNSNDWLAVAVGEYFSCGIRAPGQLYCWGANDVGQLGLGDVVDRFEPTAIAGATAVAQIAAGGGSACAIDDAGALFCWGDNLEGKPGQGDPYNSPDVLSPRRVGDAKWKLVAVGQGHVCGVRGDGPVLCWGRNSDLALGTGNADPPHARAPLPVMVEGTFKSMAASQHHTCGVRADGTLWCWGTNGHGELAVPAADLPASVPLQVVTDADWAEVAVGWFHSCARKTIGNVYCWGRAIEGQLAQDRIEPNPVPTKIEMPILWKRISAGHMHTCGVDMTGTLYCTGENRAGQLGVGDLTRRHMPVALP